MRTLLGALLVLVTACTSSAGRTPESSANTPSLPTTSTASPSSLSDEAYRALLIQPSDIPLTGLSLLTAQTGAAASGVVGEYVNADRSIKVTDVVAVFPTRDDAGIALASAQSVAPTQLTGTQSRPLTGGSSTANTAYSGTAYAGTQGERSVVIAVVRAGRAYVTLRFDSDPTSGVTADVVDRTVQAQAARLFDRLQ